MQFPIRKVTIVTFGLLFLFASAFAAPKEKKIQTNKSKTSQQASESVAAKQAPVESTTESRSTVENTAIQTQTAPVEVQPSQPVATPAPSATSGRAATYSINWFVIAAGGGSGTSTNYAMNGTVGQTAVGMGSSTNYLINSGFWQNFGGGGCCVGTRGDANGDGSVTPNILDLNFLINYIFRLSGNPGPCLDESNVNGDTFPLPNILDLNILINYIFRLGPLPGPC